MKNVLKLDEIELLIEESKNYFPEVTKKLLAISDKDSLKRNLRRLNMIWDSYIPKVETTKLSHVKRIFPNAEGLKGDDKIISDILPDYVRIYHIDSYTDDNGFRFQGVVLGGGDDPIVLNEMPLEVLKKAKRYKMWFIDPDDDWSEHRGSTPFFMWTVWF